MRVLSVILLLLAGCTLGQGLAGKAPPVVENPITGAAIATTSLDAVKPKPRPQTAAATAAATQGQVAKPVSGMPRPVAEAKPIAEPAPAPVPEPVVSLPPEAVACAKKGGKWAVAGKSGAMTCVHFTRDSGKECRKESDCEGYCLARSGTCAPVTPLFGCNEILQDNGARVTLCID